MLNCTYNNHTVLLLLLYKRDHHHQQQQQQRLHNHTNIAFALSGAVNTQGFVRSFYAPYTNLPSFIPHNSLHGSPQRLTSSEGGSVFRTINPSNHSAIIPECPTRPLPLALALPHQSAHPARSVSREQLYYSHWLDGTVSRDDSLLHFKHVIIITVLA